jgi:hypothetical protein
MLSYRIYSVSDEIQQKNNYCLNISVLENVNKNICTLPQPFIFLSFLTKVEFKLI